MPLRGTCCDRALPMFDSSGSLCESVLWTSMALVHQWYSSGLVVLSSCALRGTVSVSPLLVSAPVVAGSTCADLAWGVVGCVFVGVFHLVL